MSSTSPVEPNPLHAALDDLSARFIVNLPDSELESFERIGFHVEQAHWHYLDFMRPKNSKLPNLNWKMFAAAIFNRCALLNAYEYLLPKILLAFSKYKKTIPTCGIIVLNKKLDKCVLVSSYNDRKSFSFPRGKINQDEEIIKCAVREVYEEIGFDTTPFVRKEVSFTEKCAADRAPTTMYVATDVPDDTIFETRTRKEIGNIFWFNIKKLGDKNANYKLWGVYPFLPKLKAWIAREKTRRKRERAAAGLSDADVDGGGDDAWLDFEFRSSVLVQNLNNFMMKKKQKVKNSNTKNNKK